MRANTCSAVLLTASLLAACGGKTVSMKGTKTAPAAEAELKLKPRESGNTELTIEARHLAPAHRLRENAAQYVVWVEPLNRSMPPQNVGALSVDDDLRGKLRTVTPLEDFELFVTPEPSGRAARPSGPRVLAATIR